MSDENELEEFERRRREREQRRKEREEELRKQEEEYQRRRQERMAARAQREAEIVQSVASSSTTPPSTPSKEDSVAERETSPVRSNSPTTTPRSGYSRRDTSNPDLENYEVRAQQARLDAIRRRREERRALELQAREEERRREEQRRIRKLQADAEADKLIENLNSKIDARNASGATAQLGEVDSAILARMKERIDTLESREKGQKDIQAQLTSEVESLRKQVADLDETLSVYRAPSAKKLAIVKTPVVADAQLPDVPLPLPKISVGDAVLAMFSEHEYFTGHVTSELEDSYVVKLENGDESEVSKEKVLPPMQTILDCLKDTARKEEKIRQTYAEMEAAYKEEVAGLTAEVKQLREDYAKMKAVYGVDVRQMLMKRVNKNRPPKKEKEDKEPETTSGEEDKEEDEEEEEEEEDDEQQQFDDDVACNELVRPYSLECDVACYAAKVDEVEENRRGDTRWFTAVEQDVDFWKHLSDSVDEITQPKPICHGRRARFFQLYHDGDTNDLEVFQAKSFCAKDLDPRRVSIIDTFNEIWVYVGGDTTPEAEAEGTNAALGLAERANDGRSPMTPVVVVHQGKEPLRFRACFSDWKLVPPASGEGAAKAPEAAEDEEAQYYTYEQLLDRKNLPESVDVSQLETYLDDDAFETVFGMRRSMFVSLPEWKQTELRIKNHLF